MRLQPGFDGLGDDLLLLGVAVGELEEGGEGAVGGDERLLRFGANPEDGFVFVAVAIGVFGGELGFADAAQAADGLWLGEGSGLAGLELIVQLEQ